MKIVVSGAHRTGKTSLVDLLNEALPGYVSKAEAYYLLEETGHIFPELPTLEDYLLQLECSIGQITNSEKNVIFDRCPIDMLAYLQTINELEFFNFQSLYESVQNAMTEIDFLVFIPIEEPDLIGCPEPDLPELRDQVNEILKEWIWDFDLEVIKVGGPLLSRRNQVLEHLSVNSNN